MTTDRSPTMDDAMREALLPCPFCGSSARLGVVTEGGEANPDFGGHFVQCDNERCHGCMGLRFTCGDDPKPELIEAWNLRAAPQQQPSQAGLPGEMGELALTLDVFLAAYPDRADDAAVLADDDLLTFGTLRAILASLRLQGGQDEAGQGEVQYEVYHGDEWCAAADTEADGRHYLAMYGQDAPARLVRAITFRTDIATHGDADAEPR